MPISPINWLQGEAKGYSTPGDLLENAIAGYKMAREPKRISQEEQQRELNNRLLGHQGTHAEQVNQYYPQLKEQQLEKGGIEIAQNRHNLDISKKFDELKENANLNSINATTGLTRAQTKRLNELLGPELAAMVIANNQQQNILNAQPGKLVRDEAKDLLEIQTANEGPNKSRNENSHPGYLHGNQAAKLWEIAQQYKRSGDEEGYKHYSMLAEKELTNDLNKSLPKSSKTNKTIEELREEALAKGLGAAQAKQYAEAEERLSKVGELRQTA